MRKKSDFELVEQHGGKYALVMGVTRRARQLNDGARPLVEQTALNTVATAIEELAQGRIKIIAPVAPTRPSPLRSLPPETIQGDA
jgi:DNA-directed RNA polymerase omega subunit